MMRLALLALLVLLVGCSDDLGPSASVGPSSMDGAASEVHEGSAGSSFGGAPASGGASLGGAPPALTLESLDVPAVVELVDGEFCWGFSEECEPVPTFDPPLVEWREGRDDQVTFRIPPGACALRVEIKDQGMCWIGPRRITRSAEQVEPYEGHLTRTKPECSESWRLEIFAGECLGMGGGGS